MSATLTLQTLDVRKSAFNTQEWEAVENVFIDAIQSIQLPPDVSPADITLINSQIDQVANKASVVFARMKAKYESFKQMRELGEESAYLEIENNPPPADPTDSSKGPKKLTEAMKEALRTDWLMKNPLQGFTTSIYVLERAAKERFTFMEMVMKELHRKADQLVSNLGAIKLENEVSSDGSIARAAARQQRAS